MLDEDLRAYKRKVFLNKNLFAFCVIIGTSVYYLPLALLFILRGGVLGILALLASGLLLVLIILLLIDGGKQCLTRVTCAVPLDSEKLAGIGSLTEDVSLATGRPLPELMLIDDPKCCNLFSIRRRRRALIFIGKRLFEMMEPDELRAALAHEMAHIHNEDSGINTLTVTLRAEGERLGPLVNVLLMLLPIVFIASLALIAQKSVNMALILPLALLFPFAYLGILAQYSSIFLPSIALNRDFYADELAAKWTLQPEALIRAMKKAQVHDKSQTIAFVENVSFVPTIKENPHKYMQSATVEKRLIHLEKAMHLPIERTVSDLRRTD